MTTSARLIVTTKQSSVWNRNRPKFGTENVSA